LAKTFPGEEWFRGKLGEETSLEGVILGREVVIHRALEDRVAGAKVRESRLPDVAITEESQAEEHAAAEAKGWRGRHQKNA